MFLACCHTYNKTRAKRTPNVWWAHGTCSNSEVILLDVCPTLFCTFSFHHSTTSHIYISNHWQHLCKWMGWMDGWLGMEHAHKCEVVLKCAKHFGLFRSEKRSKWVSLLIPSAAYREVDRWLLLGTRNRCEIGGEFFVRLLENLARRMAGFIALVQGDYHQTRWLCCFCLSFWM